MKYIIGQKIGMSRVFGENNQVIPVTLVEARDNTITQVKTAEIDGYQAVQVAFGHKNKVLTSLKNHLKKASLDSARILKEFRTESADQEVMLGQTIKIDQFNLGDEVNVLGISKGKGFSGTVKRHGFKIGPRSHGSNNQRRPGSIGATTPQHVIKGKKMAGRMGGDQVTIKKIKIIDKIADKNILVLKGALPGPSGSILKIWG